MDKEKTKKNKKNSKVEKQNKNTDREAYGYDFVPTFNEWLNIDKQKERAEELEDI